VVDIFQTLVQLIVTLATLFVEIGALALRHILLIAWVAWWLWAVDWAKAWGMLAKGGWVVVVLLSLISARVWASVAPGSFDVLGLVEIGNFWWQLGAVALIVLLALFCGWLQGVFGWAPAEVDLEPPLPQHDTHH
jgi:hypothetical protein